MSGLKELVESLDGTVLFGGMIVQFSDTTFEQAVKKIYDMGVEAEREACALEAEHWQKIGQNPTHKCGEYIAAAIRGRK
jgi:hypothetical protein